MLKVSNKDSRAMSINELKDLLFLPTPLFLIKSSKNVSRRTLKLSIVRDFLDATDKVL